MAQALQLRREVLGERHPDTITCLNVLEHIEGIAPDRRDLDLVALREGDQDVFGGRWCDV